MALILLVLAAVCFLLEALNAHIGNVHFAWLGVAFIVFAWAAGGISWPWRSPPP